MARYTLPDGNIIVAEPDFIAENYPDAVMLNESVAITQVIVDPAEWLIDIGAFLDRFGASKLPILMSTDATVKALVQDIQVRKWIDLKRADVAQALDILVSKSLLTSVQKTAILTTPVSATENLALRKVYFP